MRNIFCSDYDHCLTREARLNRGLNTAGWDCDHCRKRNQQDESYRLDGPQCNLLLLAVFYPERWLPVDRVLVSSIIYKESKSGDRVGAKPLENKKRLTIYIVTH